MNSNPLQGVYALGQSLWLDEIGLDLLAHGELQRLIDQDAICGLTSNPAIFAKAILHGDDYREAIAQLAASGASAEETYDQLSRSDICRAADLLRPVYERTSGADGFVSLEVSPHLARDAEATAAEGRRLWQAVARPNLMIKVPATRECIPAIRQLLGDGINVNVTLIFGVQRYAEVAEAHAQALEQRVAAGASIDRVASVASFFLSRIDTMVDPLLDAKGAENLRGQAAIACAKLAWLHQQAQIAAERWQGLLQRGARPQRLLWASTSTKDPRYSDVKYIEELIGPGTVNTVPAETLAAYRDHGRPAVRLPTGIAQATLLPAQLAAVGIDLGEIAQRLELEGLKKFSDPFDHLLSAIAQQIAAAKSGPAAARAG
jgi:transaldolase